MAWIADFFLRLFDTDGFPPRWSCGTAWTPALGWLHIVADIAVFGAYAAIPASLAFFLLRRRDTPFPAIGWLFVAFILSCGVTHLIEATLFYRPAYRLSGLFKAVTAIVSWTTVVALVRVMPRALRLSLAQRENTRLHSALNERAQTTAVLERQRNAQDARNADLALRARRLQDALEAAAVVAMQWEAGADALLWQIGADHIPALRFDRGPWSQWPQALGADGLRALRDAERAAVASGEPMDVTIHAAPLGPSVMVRIGATADAPVRGEAQTMTGMIRILPSSRA